MGVATTIAAGGSLIGAGLSYRQAANQSKVAAKARVASDKLIADARKKSEKDYYEGLNVPLDAYEEQFAQNMANQQQTIQALQEGDTRNLIGGVQGLTAAAAAANEQTRIGLGQELYANRKMKADSRQNINQQQIQIDVGQATDQQLMARDAEQARAAAMQSGINSAANAAYIYGRGKDLYPNKDIPDIADPSGKTTSISNKVGITGNTVAQEELLNNNLPGMGFNIFEFDGKASPPPYNPTSSLAEIVLSNQNRGFYNQQDEFAKIGERYFKK